MRQRTGLCFTFTKESGTVDKRKEENLRVKINITNTLFRLMEQKSLAEITITELVKGAGVARASFYRNYESKEDVLVTLIRDVLELFRRNVKESPEGLYARENILMSFRFFYRYRRYLLDLLPDGRHCARSPLGTCVGGHRRRSLPRQRCGAVVRLRLSGA